MNNRALARVWAEVEDRLAPALGLTPQERTLYAYLLRRSILARRRSVVATKNELARAIGVCATTVRHVLRTLARAGCLRISSYLGRRGLQLDILRPRTILRASAFLACHPEERLSRAKSRDRDEGPQGSSLAGQPQSHNRYPRALPQYEKSPHGRSMTRVRVLEMGSQRQSHNRKSPNRSMALPPTPHSLFPRNGRGRSTGRFRDPKLRAAVRT